MTKIINSIFMRLVGGFACVCGPSGPVEPDEVRAQAQDAIAAKLDSYLANLNAIGDFSGSVAVTIDGEMLLAKGYGLANEELGTAATLRTKYRIGSMTKQFTSMAILILQEQGMLKVEDPLGTHLSDIPAHWAGITLHQLLTHTSGIMHSWNLSGFAETMMIPARIASFSKLLPPLAIIPVSSTPREIALSAIAGRFVRLPSMSAASTRRRMPKESADPIGRPMIPARSQIAMKANVVATDQTMVCSRLTGMPRSEARSAPSAAARIAVPSIVPRRNSITATIASGPITQATTYSSRKMMESISNLTSHGNSTRCEREGASQS